MTYQDPNFDKALYWKRRGTKNATGQAISGQLDLTPDYEGQDAQVGGKPVTKKALLKNTKRARKEANNG
jgi:hypothetical protein